MEAIPKFDIKSVIKSDIRVDISIKRTTWIGHESLVFVTLKCIEGTHRGVKTFLKVHIEIECYRRTKTLIRL